VLNARAHSRTESGFRPHENGIARRSCDEEENKYAHPHRLRSLGRQSRNNERRESAKRGNWKTKEEEKKSRSLAIIASTSNTGRRCREQGFRLFFVTVLLYPVIFGGFGSKTCLLKGLQSTQGRPRGFKYCVFRKDTFAVAMRRGFQMCPVMLCAWPKSACQAGQRCQM
jgi:hypothetical protein